MKKWAGDKIGNQLEFALKYDGVNLSLLYLIFKNISDNEIVEYIESKPTSKYSRRIWFFYEFLTQRILPIANVTTGNYVEALESSKYFSVSKGEKSPRHRIINNLLGPREFCPIVRKTSELKSINQHKIRERCEEIVSAYPSGLLKRALGYLYSKETKSSFEIEKITPSATRTERFVALLELAEKQDFCKKELLIELQNRIVDPRFKEDDYRTKQNYVGETISFGNERVHFISPKPEDLVSLMEGLLESHKIMQAGGLSPVVHAAVISYGFVFLHPFEDGNGRIHRFLIHNILSCQGLVPEGIMFPISAAMLAIPGSYDTSLESFSKPLMRLTEYTLDDRGRLDVSNETSHWYQYLDQTQQTEALYKFVEQTIENELLQELDFLAKYDKAKKAVQNIIDMPDKLIDRLIQFCMQNNGKLSAKKRKSHFDFLTNEELKKIESAITESYNRE